MPKPEFTIFLAIPFDALTQSTYRNLQKRLTEHFNEYSLTMIMGDKSAGPHVDYLKVINFKAQNDDLHRQFFRGVKRAHIIIADLTNDNPNVHVELGIALAMNKNVLRVTGRSLERLSFDVRNLKAFEYDGEEKLFQITREYLETFFQIKRLPFESSYKDLFRRGGPFILPEQVSQIQRGHFLYGTIPIGIFRDGGIKLRLKILHPTDNRSWAGVLFRSANISESGYTIRIHSDGLIELASHPDSRVISSQKFTLATSSYFDVLIDVLNDRIEIKPDNHSPLIAELDYQGAGGVFPITFEAQAEYEFVETINRDSMPSTDNISS